jgi:hypothetical protein
MTNKRSASKRLSDKDLQDLHEKVLREYLDDKPVAPEVETRGTVVVVRDYATYAAYEDPIEG